MIAGSSLDEGKMMTDGGVHEAISVSLLPCTIENLGADGMCGLFFSVALLNCMDAQALKDVT